MSLLAFDCSGPVGSLAVLHDGGTIFSETFESPRGRGGAVFGVLDRALRACGRPERIVVGTGPGSYNGLRTAVSAAEGLRLATGAEAVGLCSLLALPAAEDYLAIGDARGGVFYFAEIRGRILVGEIELLDAVMLAGRLQARRELRAFAPSVVAAHPEVAVAHPDAAILARLSMALEASAEALEPVYLKPAHITRPRGS